MSFSKTRATIKEERIVAVAGGVNDAAGGGDGEVVVGADDEIVESIFIIEAGFVTAGMLIREGGFDATPESSSGVVFGDFARTDFGFDGRFDFESDAFDVDLVVLEGGSDNVIITVAELLDIEGVFDADFDITAFGRNEGGILKPSRKVGWGNLLLDFS